MTLAIIATIVFLAHVAVWLGLPATPSEGMMSAMPADLTLEPA